MPANDPEDIIQFISRLQLVEGEMAGKYFTPMEWHKEVIRGIYGPRNAEGWRTVREAYVSVPRKNAKSTLISALAVYHLFADGEPGAQIYCVANSVEQAKICYGIISGMIRQNPFLKNYAKITDSRSTIRVNSTNSRLRVLSKLAGTAHGLNPSFVIYDELHAAKSGDLYTAMQTGMGSRRQPLMIAITTAGYDRKSICYQQYAYAKAVISGSLKDDSFYGYIKEPPEGADWESEKTWQLANPGWGISVKPEALRALYRRAKAAPSEENNFRQLYLNQWVKQSRRWLTTEAWEATYTEATPEALAEAGAVFYGGLDLSATQDLTAFCIAANYEGHYYIYPYFFLPYDTIEANRINRNVYASWVKNGDIIATIGNVVDYNYIVDYIRKLNDKVPIRAIAYDPWNSVQPIAALNPDFEVVKYPQNFSTMSPASRDFERGLLNKSILHSKSPVLKWNAENAEILMDKAGNIKPIKGEDNNKIDGLIAAIMATDLCLKNTTSSVYEDRGVISI